MRVRWRLATDSHCCDWAQEELARTKLDANQKAYHLRRLELVVETLRRKRKSKGAKSETGQSATTVG